MFETSVVQARAKAAARRPLLFSLSIGAHATAVIGIVTMSVAGVTLPDRAPNQLRIPIIASLPAMFGDEGKPKKAQVLQPAQPPKRAATTSAVVAPTLVPEHVTQLASTPSSTTDAGPSTGDS